MSAPEKPSVSSLMSQAHEVSRFENLFFKTLESAYYNNEWGLDWLSWLSTNYELPLASFLSYITQESAKKGIIVSSITGKIEDFTLKLNVTVDGIDYQIEREV